MFKKYQRLIASAVLAVVAAAVLAAAFWFGVFSTWQDKLADKLFLKREPRADIIILAIDDKSVAALGQWPWPRATHARALSLLAQGGAKAVGYDVIFSEPSRVGAGDDNVLAQALARLPVVLPLEAAPLEVKETGSFYAAKLVVPLPVLAEKAAVLGWVNVLADADGVVRRLPVNIVSESGNYKSLSVVLAEIVGGDTKNLPSALRVNFVGPPGSFEAISFSDLLAGRAATAIFKDKIVLVGATSADLHDNQMTPFSLGQVMAGVEIHANALNTILNGDWLRDASRGNVLSFIFLLALAVALIFSLAPRLWLAALLSLAAWLVYLLTALAVFGQGLILNLVYPSLAFWLSLMVILAYYYLAESREKRYLRQSFQFYLEGSVIEEIIKDPAKLKLGGQKKEMTVLFSDIRGFTTLSEKTEPEIMVSLLNEYFTAMTEIILNWGGVLDKFIGDAIMAFWGAPREAPGHAFLACDAALKMIERLTVLKSDWSRRGLPDLNIGIGINSGAMIVGNMGSSSRFNYTVIGDNVNLASRLEGLNKQYQAGIIISQFTYERAKDDFACEYLDKVNVKGKETAVEIYKLVGPKA